MEFTRALSSTNLEHLYHTAPAGISLDVSQRTNCTILPTSDGKKVKFLHKIMQKSAKKQLPRRRRGKQMHYERIKKQAGSARHRGVWYKKTKRMEEKIFPAGA
ncbi:MAG TPA: hypothetical protein H9795_07925 [Candidatus Fournierella merdigallinarum]|nr:hypothetical protein [Candidatus Fournierella merdigallinarum]